MSDAKDSLATGKLSRAYEKWMKAIGDVNEAAKKCREAETEFLSAQHEDREESHRHGKI